VDQLDTTTPHGELILTLMGDMAEFERKRTRARCDEGIKRAKARATVFGRESVLDAGKRRRIAERYGARVQSRRGHDLGGSTAGLNRLWGRDGGCCTVVSCRGAQARGRGRIDRPGCLVLLSTICPGRGRAPPVGEMAGVSGMADVPWIFPSPRAQRRAASSSLRAFLRAWRGCRSCWPLSKAGPWTPWLWLSGGSGGGLLSMTG
jgi:hypothetical protein